MKIALLGTVGIPGRYGGFETLAENLVRYHRRIQDPSSLTVWCSSKNTAGRPHHYESARLHYIPLKANGVQSILYDAISLWQAVRSGHDRIILLGVSGAMLLPLIRIMSQARIVTNVDGIEWKRPKWRGPARAFLRASERAAVRFSHSVIADNQVIADYVRLRYGRDCHVIAYGGDHAVASDGGALAPAGLPEQYALALCRIEPENNVHMILAAWAQLDRDLVFVGNWSNSAYGRDLKSRFSGHPKVHLLDAIYAPAALRAVRSRANLYVHGHSAGGTNPALVEMMHFGVPVLAHGCAFNRQTTEERALYFTTEDELISQIRSLTPAADARIRADMLEIAKRRYTWDNIGAAYFALLSSS